MIGSDNQFVISSMQEFEGSWDRNTPVTHFFYKEVRLLDIRIQPIQWHVNIAMRFELLGCAGK